MVNISYSAGTTTRFPLPFPSGSVATTFTSYTGTSFPFAMGTFQVGSTGNYSLAVGGISSGVGLFVVQGTFAPNASADPSTPLANVLAGTQAPATIPSIALQAGVQYTFLVVVSSGSGTGTVAITGGCVVIGGETCLPGWSNAGVGDWDNAANWSTGSEPTSLDETSINNGGTARVTTAGNASGNLRIGAGAGTSGTLEVIGGSLTTAGLEAGRDPGSSGTVRVSGGGALNQSSGSLFELGIAGGVGTATVEGAGSVIDWVGGTPRVGSGGTGTLTLRDGGRFAATSLELSRSGGTSVVHVGTGGVAGVLDTNIQTGPGPGPATLNFNHSDNVLFARTISGGVAVNKLGAGSLTLSGANTHTTTVVQAGTLLVNGAQPTSGVVLQGGVLGGTGVLGQLSATGGTVAPGVSPGLITVATATFNAATTFFVELNGPVAGTGYDQLAVLGGVTLGNATLAGSTGAVHAAGAQFVVIDKQSPGAVSGTFNGLPEGATVGIGGQTFRISYVGGDGNDVVLTVVAPVPSMPVLGLMALALMLAGLGYFKAKAAAGRARRYE